MQKSYIFGLNAEQLHDATANDFVELRNVAGGTENHNPYGAGYFNDPSQMALTQDNAKVTSIPSPYARMHITDIAFRELMAGVGVMDAHAIRDHINNMSGDYLRAMSHCLDIYEMMFHFNELDLIDKGITIKKIELVSKRDGKYRDLLQRNPNLSCFIDTLDLFRQRYLQDIRDRHVPAYKFDFSQMYIFKYNGKTFAATSPFTGFFAKADCDLTNAELSVTWENNGMQYVHKLFTNTPKEWLGIKERDPKFLEFLYLLLKDNLGKIFKHLFEAVKACIPDVRTLENESFAAHYPKFNFGEEVLPQIAGNTRNLSYIRPDGLDCSYLKYLLYLSKPVDLSISETAYEKDINDRVFPEGTDNRVPWIGVNDFLSDTLIVLPYDINENYYAATYIDENNNSHRRCLLPLKRDALNYLEIDVIENSIFVKKYSDSHYAVTLRLNLNTGGKVDLRRDYYDIEDKNCNFPNGVLKDLQNANHHFAFGIYPFVRSTRYMNIYKVLFYNDFKWPNGYRGNGKPYDLTFYYFDNNHIAQPYAKDTNVTENQTNKADTDFNVNTHYYHVENETTIPNENDREEFVAIDFAELSLSVVKNPNSGNPLEIKGTAIIVPKYHPVAFSGGDTTIAVDLGTSNTYLAYQHTAGNVLEEPKEISTIHQGWNEFTLMNCYCTQNDRHDACDANRQDLYLRTDDKKKLDDVCLPAQLCEFIPTKIKRNEDNTIQGYKFPIPSIINNLRVNGVRDLNYTNRLPLVHSSIPFAYYSIGKRPDTEANSYDAMSNGEFKWFYVKDQNGNFNFDNVKKSDFESFVNELLFITRSHMLCCGYELENCSLIWTYPLSFQQQLLSFYKQTWDLTYCKYFNRMLLNANGQIINQRDIDNLVKYTNESRSPIYECMTNPGAANLLTVLMDIGGGSTDVIGYFQNEPQFVTSFGFAGNALYLGGSMNHKDFANTNNYMRRYVQRNCQTVFNVAAQIDGVKRIDANAPINTLMNYGFSEEPVMFNALFNNASVQFMLQFHNAAIYYHTAQLCKISKSDEVPDEIYLTGNGSNLLRCCQDPSLPKRIFSKVYGQACDRIKITFVQRPKAATTLGALKGNRSNLQFNENSASKQVKMLGDENSIYSVNPLQPQINIEDAKEKMNAVRNNVLNFIDVFYDSYQGTPNFDKNEVLDCMRYVDGDQMLSFDPYLANSMFFQYISLLMEQLSIKICQRPM